MLIIESAYWFVSPSSLWDPRLEIFAENWQEIEKWLKFALRVRDKIQCTKFVASKLLAKRIPWCYQLRYQIVYLENDCWFELAPFAEIYTHEVPNWALEGVIGEEIDVSERFQENVDWTDF